MASGFERVESGELGRGCRTSFRSVLLCWPLRIDFPRQQAFWETGGRQEGRRAGGKEARRAGGQGGKEGREEWRQSDQP